MKPVSTLPPSTMQALVQVANGVAPALNDLLTIITGRANLLLDGDTLDDSTRESVHQIYTAGECAVSLIRQLQLFGGGEVPHTQRLDLNQLVTFLEPTLRRLLGPAISTEIALAADHPLVWADPALLEQVLLSLTLNARDAMPRAGKLLVATTSVIIDETNLANFAGGRCGNFAVLSVADNGCGIAPEIRPHIFEPFFTTKPAGRSTGLGLAAVFGAVQQHQGWIQVESAPGAGAEFQVFLPTVAPGTDSGPKRPDEDLRTCGNETILLVEDEDTVREFTFAVLQSHGYRVLQARSTTEALETWKWHGPRIKLLLTDMVLEDRMTGLELAQRLRTEDPQLCVICTSGHSREIMPQTEALPGGCVFLQKPCRPQALVRAVRTLLDATGHTSTPSAGPGR